MPQQISPVAIRTTITTAPISAARLSIIRINTEVCTLLFVY
jgi:hypothetical protein